MSEIVQYERRGQVAIITLNRPEARNAVNGDVAQGLEAAIDKMEEDPDVWVGVLTANTVGQKIQYFVRELISKRLIPETQARSTPNVVVLAATHIGSAQNRSSLLSTDLQRQVDAKLFSHLTWWWPHLFLRSD